MCTIQDLFNQQGTSISRGENIQKNRANPKVLCQEKVITVPLSKTGSMMEQFSLSFFLPLLIPFGALTPREIPVLSPSKYLEFN